MEAGMQAIRKLDFNKPDETREPDMTKVGIIRTENGTVARFEMQPGWTWEDCVKPLVGTESCEVPHLGYVEQGTILIVSDDGTKQKFSKGDIYMLAPGHQAEVTSKEPFVAYEFQTTGAEQYAKS